MLYLVLVNVVRRSLPGSADLGGVFTPLLAVLCAGSGLVTVTLVAEILPFMLMPSFSVPTARPDSLTYEREDDLGGNWVVSSPARKTETREGVNGLMEHVERCHTVGAGSVWVCLLVRC